MQLTTLLGTLIVVLLGLVCVGAAIRYLQHRDVVSRGVALAFSPFAAVCVASSWQAFGQKPPGLVSGATGILFLLQPVFVLYLASLVHYIPRRILAGSFALMVAAAVPAVAIRPAPAWVGVILVGAFVLVEGLAAFYLLIEARRRSGPGAQRLGIAAISTGLFAAAILAAGVSAIGPAAATPGTAITIALALIASLGYLVAFMPPAPVRRLWQAAATVQYEHAMLARSGATVEEIWADYAALAARVTGSPCALLLPDGDDMTVVATAGFKAGAAGPAATTATASADALPPPLRSTAERLIQASGARFVSSLPLPLPGSERSATLMTLSPQQSLFHETELALLATLGVHTAIIAERRAILADQEALTSRLAATVEALRSASQAKSDFLASMSHELRTPLSAILGFSDLMRNEPLDGDSVRVPLEWVEHIHRGGEHLLALINDVLDLAKVEAGRLELRTERIELGTAINELMRGIQPLAERKSLRLSATVEATAVEADRGRFRQILYNLLSNAIKFTPNGGEVRIEASEADGEIRIAVVDTGVGIAAKDREAVFDEFKQVGAVSDREGGTGLGLALTRRLVQAHGGRMELESTVGEGSRFTVILPAQGVELPAALPTAADPAPARPATSRSEVLVIEDDPSAMRLLREYLEPAGYTVRVAADAERGLAMAHEHAPAAVILDVLLPTMDGWDVLRRLKADERLRDVPVIMATVVDERDIGLALGATDYLVKPIRRDTLLACLERHALPAQTEELPRILAIDDEPEALALIRAMLDGQGFDVITASGGIDGIARARQGRVDMVICDLVMPDLDGFSVVAELKRDPRTMDIPIIVCTAHDLSSAEKERLNGQILGIVIKGQHAGDGLRHWLEAGHGAHERPAPAARTPASRRAAKPDRTHEATRA